MTDLDDVRDWVGAEPDDDAVNEALVRFAGQTHVAKRAALSILRRRYADLEGAASSVTIVDDVAWTAARRDQAESLARKIGALARELGEAGLPLVDALTSAPICAPPNLR